MYLSQLLLDGLDRHAAKLLADPYKLHAAIMTGFAPREAGQPSDERVLFRQEPPTGSAWIQVIVQSVAAPDWQALHERYRGAARAQFKDVTLEPRPGQTLRFRLRANPTVCRDAKRHALVGEAAQREWLERRAEKCGFLTRNYVVVDEGFSRGHKKSKEPEDGGEAARQRAIGFRAVRYEGSLQVVEPATLLAAVRAGIGPAKGLGCGLLSLAGA